MSFDVIPKFHSDKRHEAQNAALHLLLLLGLPIPAREVFSSHSRPEMVNTLLHPLNAQPGMKAVCRIKFHKGAPQLFQKKPGNARGATVHHETNGHWLGDSTGNDRALLITFHHVLDEAYGRCSPLLDDIR